VVYFAVKPVYLGAFFKETVIVGEYEAEIGSLKDLNLDNS